ncbi:hypothetical protein DXC24_15070 [Clostridium sp. OM08-29]|nr:hypothetical protein DXC24_15070 [Clostridium sp. OM08-29]
MINTKKLASDIDARTVVENLFSRDDFTKSGATMFVRCPAGHSETRLNHCAVYAGGCKCFSCGESFSTIEMVKKYFPGLAFPEVCEKIAEAAGTDISLYENGKTVSKRKKEALPFTEELLTALNLKNPKKDGFPSLEYYYREEKSECLLYLAEKAKEMLSKYKNLLSVETNELLKIEWKSRYKIVQAFLQEQWSEKPEKILPLFRL